MEGKDINKVVPLEAEYEQKDICQAIEGEEYEVRRRVSILAGSGEERIAALDPYHGTAAHKPNHREQLIKLKNTGIDSESR